MGQKPSNSYQAVAKIRVRKFYANDLNNVLNLFIENLGLSYDTTQKFKKRFLFSYILSLVFSLLGLDTFIGSVAQADDGNIVGAIITRRFPLGKNWVLGPVAVHTNFRNLGIATRMMDLIMRLLREKKAKVAIVSVKRDNIQGRIFFEKFDFKYLEPIFSSREKAHNYARIIALIHGYLRNPSYKIEQYPSRRRNASLPRIKKIRMWYIMLKEF